MALKKEKADPILAVYARTDNLSQMYTSDPFWRMMKLGCDALREGTVSPDDLKLITTERDHWGPSTSNRQKLSMIVERLVGVVV